MQSLIKQNTSTSRCPEDGMDLGPFLAQYVLSNPFESTAEPSNPIFVQIYEPSPKTEPFKYSLRPSHAPPKKVDKNPKVPTWTQSTNKMKKNSDGEAVTVQVYCNDSYSIIANDDIDLEELMKGTSFAVKSESPKLDAVPDGTIKIEPQWDNDYSTKDEPNDPSLKSCENEGSNFTNHSLDLQKEDSIKIEQESEIVSTKKLKRAVKSKYPSCNLLRSNRKKRKFTSIYSQSEDKKKQFFDNYLSKGDDVCLKLLINEFRELKNRIDKLESNCLLIN